MKLLRFLALVAIEVLYLPIRIVVIIVNLVISIKKHIKGEEKFADYWGTAIPIMRLSVTVYKHFIETGRFNFTEEEFCEAFGIEKPEDDIVIEDDDIFEDILGEA